MVEKSAADKAEASLQKELAEAQDLALFLEEKAKAEIRALIAAYPAAARDPIIRALEALIQEERANRYTPGGFSLSTRVSKTKGITHSLRAKIDDLKHEETLFAEEDPFSDPLFVTPNLGVSGISKSRKAKAAPGASSDAAAAAAKAKAKAKAEAELAAQQAKARKGKLFKQGPLPETPHLEMLMPFHDVTTKEQLAEPAAPVLAVKTAKLGKALEKQPEPSPLPETQLPHQLPADLAKEHAKEYGVLAEQAHRSKLPGRGRTKGRLQADSASPSEPPADTGTDEAAASEDQVEEENREEAP